MTRNRGGLIVEDRVDYKRMRDIAVVESKSKALTVATSVLTRAIADCPKDTGYLASSHYLKGIDSGFEVGNTAVYAPFVMAMPQSWLKNGKAQWLSYAFRAACKSEGVAKLSGGREL